MLSVNDGAKIGCFHFMSNYSCHYHRFFQCRLFFPCLLTDYGKNDGKNLFDGKTDDILPFCFSI